MLGNNNKSMNIQIIVIYYLDNLAHLFWLQFFFSLAHWMKSFQNQLHNIFSSVSECL